MSFTERMGEALAVAAQISPQTVNNTTANTGWFKAGQRTLFVLSVGATDTTVDFKIRSATASDGTGAADITGKAVTQLSATDDNKIVTIEIRAEELLALTGQPSYIYGLVTVGNGSTGAAVSCLALTDNARFKPQTSIAAVAQSIY